MITEVILDKVYEEWLFQEIAKKIANFSPKLRRAMLIDIARNMDFDTQPTPLQAAFLKVGIHLEEYAESVPARTNLAIKTLFPCIIRISDS